MPSYKLLSEALQRDVYRLRSQLSSAESSNALLLKDLKTRDASTAELVEENRKLKARVEELRLDCVRLVPLNRSLQADNAEFSDKIEDLEEKTGELEASNRALESDNLRLQRQIDHWREQAEDGPITLEYDLEQAQKRVGELEAENAKLQASNQALNVYNVTIETENDRLSTRILELKNDRNGLHQENGRLKASLAAMEASLDEMVELRTSAQTSYISRQETRIKELDTKVNELERERSAWGISADQWMDRAYQFQQDFKQAQARVEELERERS